jgi:hypothetical protein
VSSDVPLALSRIMISSRNVMVGCLTSSMLKLTYSFIVQWRFFARVCIIAFNRKIIANHEFWRTIKGAVVAYYMPWLEDTNMNFFCVRYVYSASGSNSDPAMDPICTVKTEISILKLSSRNTFRSSQTLTSLQVFRTEFSWFIIPCLLIVLRIRYFLVY